MTILFWGLTISLIGKVFLAVSVLWAHTKLAHEHMIDQKVIRSFKVEKIVAIVGIFLIILGYALEIYFYGFTPFFQCSTENCFTPLVKI
jgi:hypothetical protein